MARTLIFAALVGSAFTLGIIGLMSMAQSPTNLLEHVRVEYGPHPRDMVQIKEGTPYIVPPGRIFVLTGLGETGTVSSVCDKLAVLSVDGTIELRAGIYAYAVNGAFGNEASSVAHVPSGFTVASGSTIAVAGACGFSNAGRAWGYLADQ